MPIEVVSLSELLGNAAQLLGRISGPDDTIVVELPDHRLVAIRSLEPEDEDGSVVSDLLETNPRFRELVERSKASPRTEFTSRARE